MLYCQQKGNPIYCDPEKDHTKWYYADNDELCVKENFRPCVCCGGTSEHDDCLGMLPGVKYACCGHGDRDNAYIMFENGVIVRGFDVITTI